MLAPTADAATAHKCKSPQFKLTEKVLAHNVTVGKCMLDDIVVIAESELATAAKDNHDTCVAASQQKPPDYSGVDVLAGIVSTNATNLTSGNEALKTLDEYFTTYGNMELLTQGKVFGKDSDLDELLLSKAIKDSEKVAKDLSQESDDLSSHDCQEVQRSADFLEIHYGFAKAAADNFINGAKP